MAITSRRAQAYAGTVYDDALHAKFLEKMNYMIDTLYDLSQKSGNPKEAGGPSNADPTKVPPGPNRSEYDSNLTAQGIRTDYWNWGKGFISAYPPDQFIMLENGATYGGRNNQIWAPYYTLHKILAGLLDCYEVGGNEKALEIAKGMALWVIAAAQAGADRNANSHVEPLHRRRVRRHERSDGPAVSDDQRSRGSSPGRSCSTISTFSTAT